MKRLTATITTAILLASAGVSIAGTPTASPTAPRLTTTQVVDLQAALTGTRGTGGNQPSLHCVILAAELALATAACVTGDAFACATAVLLAVEFATDCTGLGRTTVLAPA